ncbi:MAG: PQQ-binding-like beta-propeller repeat protein [Kiritimatiellae bacterium]|nr:PQQ-binding-like beta-propeller repeat protein [Kiritimatiellia bacterium]
MKNPAIRSTLHFLQKIALIFLILLGIHMLHDAIRGDQVLTAGLEQLEHLKQQDMSNPKLAAIARELDYLYRASYFQTKDKRRFGLRLLGVGLLVFCLLLGAERFSLPPELSVPKGYPVSPEHDSGELIATTVCGVVALFLVLAYIRRSSSRPLPDRSDTVAVASKTAADVPATVSESGRQPSPTVAKPPVLAEAVEAETHQWPQFRGSLLPNRNALPVNWRFREKWKTAIASPGYNSPVVWDGSVFLTGADEKARTLFCYDVHTGKEKWRVVCDKAPQVPEVSEDTGLAPPTVCVDAERVYAIFGTGEMVCCSHIGETVWRKQLPFPDITYGYASSPLLLGDRIIVQYDLNEVQTLYAFNVLNGATLWEKKRDAAPSWSSPVAWVTDGKAIIFTAGCRTAEAYDAQTGDSLWRLECMGGEVAASGAAREGIFYFSNTGAFTGAFSATDGKILFKNEDTPSPDVSSAVLYNDLYLLFTSGGSVLGVDAKDGKELFEENFDNGFYASPVAVGGKIIAANLDGDLLLLSATREKLTVEAKYALKTKLFAVPALSQGNLIVRTGENDLICLEAEP